MTTTADPSGNFNLTFGEVDPTGRVRLQRSDVLQVECSPGTTPSLLVDGARRGPLTRQMSINLVSPGHPPFPRPAANASRAAQLPYQLDWSFNSTAAAGASSALTFTITLLPADYRAVPASDGYFEAVTIDLSP